MLGMGNLILPYASKLCMHAPLVKWQMKVTPLSVFKVLHLVNYTPTQAMQ